MTICSRTIDCCFPYCFGIFCDLIIPKQSIEMQFFPKRVVEIIKKWAPPVKLHSSAPPPGTEIKGEVEANRQERQICQNIFEERK